MELVSAKQLKDENVCQNASQYAVRKCMTIANLMMKSLTIFATHLLGYGFIRPLTFSRQILILTIFPIKWKTLKYDV